MNQKLIKNTYIQAESIEPVLTHIMVLTGYEVITENAKKSKKSYKRKVKTRMVRNKISQRQAMSQIKDLIRYTIVTYNYSDAVIILKHLIRKLEHSGCVYRESLTKNYFMNPKDSGYMGLHLYFTYDGFIFEIQIHTLETLRRKEATHAVYKKESALQ